MKFKVYITFLLLIIKISLFFEVQSYASEQNESIRKTLKLKNNLEVLLISNKQFKKSSVGLSINLGAINSPPNLQGLPHFIEHLIFFGGSSRYPQVNFLRDYIKNSNGSMNASTYAEKTIFYYDIEHTKLLKSLDIFSAQIESPLLDKEFINKEIESIQSEHILDIDNDNWKSYQLVMSLAKKGHPRAMFTGGSKLSLKGVTKKDIKEFYETNYSASIMKLVIMSNLSINNMEKEATDLFSSVGNFNKKIKRLPKAFPSKNLPLYINMKSSQKKFLRMTFELPSSLKFWESKPLDVISELLKNKGKGSLYSYLNREGLISSMRVWSEDLTYASYFQLFIELSDEGLSRKQEVLESFFSYIELLKKNDLPEYLFEDSRKIGKLTLNEFILKSNKRKAKSLSSAACFMPLLELEKNYILPSKFDKKVLREYLSLINPNNLIVVTGSPKFKGTKLEPHYETLYDISKAKKINVSSLKNNFTIKSKNRFIPKNVKLIKNEKRDKINLVDDKYGEIFFKFDEQFKLPKSTVELDIYNKHFNLSPENRVLTKLYVDILNDAIQEWLFPLIEIGDSVTINLEHNSIKIKISAFSQNISKIIHGLAEKINSLRVSEKTFEKFKNINISRVENLKNGDLFSLNHKIALQFMNGSYSDYDLFDKDRKINFISDINLKKFDNFKENIFLKSKLQGIIYGNIKYSSIKEAFTSLPKKLGIEKSNSIKTNRLNLKIDSHFQLGLKVQSKNNFYWLMIPANSKTIKNMSEIRLLDSILSSRFYNFLRTEKQLAYDLGYFTSFQFSSSYINMFIQTDKHDPSYLDSEVKSWIKESVTYLKNLSDKEFILIKNGLIRKIESDPNSQLEMIKRLKDMTFGYKYSSDNFHLLLKKEIEKISKKEIIETARSLFYSKSNGSLLIFSHKDPSKLKALKDRIKIKSYSDLKNLNKQ